MSVQDPFRQCMPSGRTCGRWSCQFCGPKSTDKPALRRSARRILKQVDEKQNRTEAGDE